eukprot:364781-Chlamydomonas_euryale.AAC.16
MVRAFARTQTEPESQGSGEQTYQWVCLCDLNSYPDLLTHAVGRHSPDCSALIAQALTQDPLIRP